MENTPYNLEYFLWRYIWWGLLPKEEILNRLSYFDGKKTDTERLSSTYNGFVKIQAKKIKEVQFSNQFHRLTRVFKSLNREGIISVHNAGSTNSAGLETINELEHMIQDQVLLEEIAFDLEKLKGYCFYHEQDIEDLVPKIGDHSFPIGSIFLSFGSLNEESGVSSLAIGEKICAILKNEQLEFKWNQSIRSKIELVNFIWTNTNDKTNWENQAMDYFINKNKIPGQVTNNNLKIDQEVKIKSGAFMGFSGKITSINNENESLKVKISVFGKDTEIDILFDQL